MKISMYATGNKIQFNLEPENDHEKNFMRMLSSYTGKVEVHSGVNISDCKGGYVRNFGRDNNTTAITISKPEKKQDTNEHI